jgi:hypothetical protein
MQPCFVKYKISHKKRRYQTITAFFVAGWTGLEPATSGVTGQRCNQLYYHPTCEKMYAREEL